MPVPCRGKQASLGLARALYASTGAITATILNILVMTFVCMLAGTPSFVWRSIVWIIITKPMLKCVSVQTRCCELMTHTAMFPSWARY